MRCAYGLLLIGLLQMPGLAEDSPANLIKLYYKADKLCNGGDDYGKEIGHCADRGTIEMRLEALHWCYGRPGETSVQMDWHNAGKAIAPLNQRLRQNGRLSVIGIVVKLT